MEIFRLKKKNLMFLPQCGKRLTGKWYKFYVGELEKIYSDNFHQFFVHEV